MSTAESGTNRTLCWIVFAGFFSLAFSLWMFRAQMACVDHCFIDYPTLSGHIFGKLETHDARLNSWILSWVQHSLAHEPSALFDGNTLYPAKNALTGSEHMIGMAVQTAPLRLLTDNAVAVHQAGIVLATALTGLNTFVLTFLLTGAPGAAMFAGLAGMTMPWRWPEFAHLQLLSAQWFPLVWLLFGRSLRGSLSGGGRALLATALSLQLLTSFYLTYFLTFSLAVLAVVFVLGRTVTRRGLVTTAATCAVPYGLFVLLAIPYLQRDAIDALGQSWGTASSLPWSTVWQNLAPQSILAAAGLDPVIAPYAIPAVVLLLAVAALPLLLGLPRRSPEREMVPYVYGLLGMAVASVVLCLGWTATINGSEITLPGGWAARWFPGYENMRAPQRWAIVIGLALPPLAGIGLARLSALLRRGPAPMLLSTLPLLAAFVLLGSARSSSLAIPTAQAWTAEQRRPYEFLATLPEGAVMSLPWPAQDVGGVELESNYTLLSTLDWRRTLNGFTAYRPRSYSYLHNLAQGLPDPRRIESLVRFTGLRWIVRNLNRPDADQSWAKLVAAGTLRVAYGDDNAVIYEVLQREQAASWRDALHGQGQRPQTVTGQSRAALEPKDWGTLNVEGVNVFQVWGAQAIPVAAIVVLVNEGERTWPGLDPESEGLVRLRATFFEPESGEIIHTQFSALHVDVPPHSRVTTLAMVVGPARARKFRVDFDLVQIVNGIATPINAKPVTRELAGHTFRGM